MPKSLKSLFDAKYDDFPFLKYKSSYMVYVYKGAFFTALGEKSILCKYK